MIQTERLEAHWLACMASLGGGARVTRIPGAIVVAHPKFASSIMNFIALRDLDPAALPATLEIGEAILAGFGRPPALFVAQGSGEGGGLVNGLRALGWRSVVDQVVLVRDLTDLPGIEHADVAIKQVARESLSAWGDLLVSAYEVEPGQGAEIKAGWTQLTGQVSHYQAILAGQPAGTGLTWLQDDLGGLYCGAVMPQHRRQGIARALLLARMHDLAKAGARWAYMQTEKGSPMAVLAQQRLRFQVAYERALWIPM